MIMKLDEVIEDNDEKNNKEIHFKNQNSQPVRTKTPSELHTSANHNQQNNALVSEEQEQLQNEQIINSDEGNSSSKPGDQSNSDSGEDKKAAQLIRDSSDNPVMSASKNKNNSKMKQSKTSSEGSHIEPAKKQIFVEYQSRWKANNRNIFRRIIIWHVGDDEKIEDQLKLMINYLSCIFIFFLVLAGFLASYFFNYKNKTTIEDNIISQANSILGNSISQYSKQTEQIFAGYEYILTYLTDIVLSQLKISNKLIDFNTITSFPAASPGNMHEKTSTSKANCPLYTGSDIQYGIDISLSCIDYYEFNSATVPLVNDDVYQLPLTTSQLNDAFDVLNYILEAQFLEFFTSNIFNIYFGLEWRMLMYGYPGLSLADLESTYNMHSRPWYATTRSLHVAATSTKQFRIISSPYFDPGLKAQVVTVSKAMLAPNALDTSKRYLSGKGRFIGVANVDIVLAQFEQLFEDLVFYTSGFFVLVDHAGNLLNQPKQFKELANISDSVTQYTIEMLLTENNWKKLRDNDQEDFYINELTTIQGLTIIVASKVASDNYYDGESMTNLIIVPKSEIYDEIYRQENSNFKHLLISSLGSLGVFLFLAYFCQIFVKKQIVKMVSAINQLNQNALKLAEKQDNPDNTNNKDTHQIHSIQDPATMEKESQKTKKNKQKKKNSKSSKDNTKTTSFSTNLIALAPSDSKVKGIMENGERQQIMTNLGNIQQTAQSQTVKELVQGFKNQLQGISRMGKGEQNVLKNSQIGLHFDSAKCSNTHIQNYAAPLLEYLHNTKNNQTNNMNKAVQLITDTNQGITNINNVIILTNGSPKIEQKQQQVFSNIEDLTPKESLLLPTHGSETQAFLNQDFPLIGSPGSKIIYPLSTMNNLHNELKYTNQDYNADVEEISLSEQDNKMIDFTAIRKIHHLKDIN